jgi:hypothetical protein
VEGVAPSTPRGRSVKPPRPTVWVDATRNRRRRSGALQGSARPRRGHLQQQDTRRGSRGDKPVASARPPPTTGHPQGPPMEGVAPSTPVARRILFPVKGILRVEDKQTGAGKRCASPRRRRSGALQGSARPRRGHLQQQDTRRVHRWRASLRRRRLRVAFSSRSKAFYASRTNRPAQESGARPHGADGAAPSTETDPRLPLLRGR